jgi:hypothetical protein
VKYAINPKVRTPFVNKVFVFSLFPALRKKGCHLNLCLAVFSCTFNQTWELQILHTRYKHVCFSCTNVRKILHLHLLGSFIASQVAEGVLYFSIIAVFPRWLCVGSVICSFIHRLCKVTINFSNCTL